MFNRNSESTIPIAQSVEHLEEVPAALPNVVDVALSMWVEYWQERGVVMDNANLSSIRYTSEYLLRSECQDWERDSQLEYLSDAVGGYYRALVAKETRNVSILEELAVDGDTEIRFNVAINVNTPLHVLKRLSYDSSTEVIAGVARNTNSPLCILKELSNSTDRVILSALASNPSLPEELLYKLCSCDVEEARVNVAIHSDLSPRIMRVLAHDTSHTVRSMLIEHQVDIPPDLLILLSKDLVLQPDIVQHQRYSELVLEENEGTVDSMYSALRQIGYPANQVLLRELQERLDSDYV